MDRAACRAADEPKAPGPDVVFLGRSNVGKSSLINRLLGVKNLARTSSSPGRTQSIFFYRINESCYFVDLPGYGYAKVPEAIRRKWKPMIEGYLERRRRRIALACLVVDPRHAASELDCLMRDWLEAREIPYVVAATKSDKLSAGQRARAGKGNLEAFEASGVGGGPVLVSARTGRGIPKLWKYLDEALEPDRTRTWTFES